MHFPVDRTHSYSWDSKAVSIYYIKVIGFADLKKRKSNGDETPPEQCTAFQRVKVRVMQARARARQGKKLKYGQTWCIVLGIYAKKETSSSHEMNVNFGLQ